MQRAGTRTIPLRFGIRASIVFLFCFETLAYLAGAAMYLFGGLGRGWLWCLVAIAAAGTAINVLFAVRPTPRRADLANRCRSGSWAACTRWAWCSRASSDNPKITCGTPCPPRNCFHSRT